MWCMRTPRLASPALASRCPSHPSPPPLHLTIIQELEFEAIQPTRAYREEERSLRVGGVEVASIGPTCLPYHPQTSVIESIPTTVYNVEKITARTTSTPSLDVGGIGLEALRDPGQLGALLQVTVVTKPKFSN